LIQVLTSEEFSRLGVPNAEWRICELNMNIKKKKKSGDATKLIPSYPAYLAVPDAVKDSVIKYVILIPPSWDYFSRCRKVTKFRTRKRIPALSWLHGNGASLCRSSQPRMLTSMMTSQKKEEDVSDESYLQYFINRHKANSGMNSYFFFSFFLLLFLPFRIGFGFGFGFGFEFEFGIGIGFCFGFDFGTVEFEFGIGIGFGFGFGIVLVFLLLSFFLVIFIITHAVGLMILDARSEKAAQANRAVGGGFEEGTRRNDHVYVMLFLFLLCFFIIIICEINDDDKSLPQVS
jgi:hypothetical protein